MSGKDRLFRSPRQAVSDFVFDERVARVFPDMISRSVPGYGLNVALTSLLAGRYARDGSRLYDLGCSLGAVTQAMRTTVRAKRTRIVAVDNSAAMIDRLQADLAASKRSAGPLVEPLCQDILETPIENASVVVLNFTLQFIAPRRRLPLLRRIAAGLLPGGILLLSEKLRFARRDEQQLQNRWHHDFKRSQGYSELEIAGKREALENVLKPDTLATHRRRLGRAGFAPVSTWFQAFGFVSLAAFRPPAD